jgi:hypothetical protein
MYAKMAGNLILKQRSLLEAGKVYNIRCFKVVRAKSSYRVTSAFVMIYFTLYLIIEVCKRAPSVFPLYVYELSSPNGKDLRKYCNVCYWMFYTCLSYLCNPCVMQSISALLYL